LNDVVKKVTSDFISFNITLIVTKNGIPHASVIATSSLDEFIHAVDLIQSDKHKIPILDCLSLAMNMSIHVSTSHTQYLILNCSPLFSDTSISWSSIEAKLRLQQKHLSVISFCGEIHALKELTMRVEGKYISYIDNMMLSLNSFDKNEESADLVQIGIASFTQLMTSAFINHDGSVYSNEIMKNCPRCSWALENVPQECFCCGLLSTIDTSDILSKRSIKTNFIENQKSIDGLCKCCSTNSNLKLRCADCNNLFCKECYEVVQNNWRMCPFCGK
jgi:hypothetical protein